MRLVNTLLSLDKINDKQIGEIEEIILSEFTNERKIYQYDYPDDKYHELDIDLFDVEFTRDTIYKDIDRLIGMYEKIIEILPMSVDFIAGNDDTSAAVEIYQQNSNNIANFGLFVTRRKIDGFKPYYQSEICNAYVNFRWVSFGCLY